MFRHAFFAGAIALVCALLPSLPAQASSVDNMNDIINQTNFVVDVGHGKGTCSGTLISLKYQLVLTNDHCVEDNVDKVEKEETDSGGKVEKITREVYRDMELKQKSYKDFAEVGSTNLQSEIVAHKAKYDLALLHIKAEKIPQTLASRLSNNEVSRGDRVFVVGNPYGFDANLNEGVISSITRKLHWDETNEDVPYYGVDAGVNPGNSGGALYNSDGELIGVPGAGIRGATGLGFAIPLPTIKTFLKENCYESVYDDKAKDHDACEQEKLDKRNAAREKAGLPPLTKDDLKKSSDLGSSTKPSLWDMIPGAAAAAPSQMILPHPKASPWGDLLPLELGN